MIQLALRVFVVAGRPIPGRKMWFGGRRSPVTRIFDFLHSRSARMSCPFCSQEVWEGADERVVLSHAPGGDAVDRRTEALLLTCANCGFIRFQSAHVLDDPRGQ